MLCPIRKNQDRSAKEPYEFELNSIRNDPENAATIRTRLSDVSWWMRCSVKTSVREPIRKIGRSESSSRDAIELSAFSMKLRGWLARPTSISIPFGLPWLRVRYESKQYKVLHADVLRKIQPQAVGDFIRTIRNPQGCSHSIARRHSQQKVQARSAVPFVVELLLGCQVDGTWNVPTTLTFSVVSLSCIQ